MSIATAIENAQDKVESAYTAVSTKGGTLPATQDLSHLPDAITSIPSGSSPVIVPLVVTPTTEQQTWSAGATRDGFSPVTVNAVTASIDPRIQARNIKSGVSILGVAGSVVELNGTTTSIPPTTSSQTVTPTSPNNAFTSVTVPAVTSSIDANITAGNIKDGVTILGVTGTYTGGGSFVGIPREINQDLEYTMPSTSFTFSTGIAETFTGAGLYRAFECDQNNPSTALTSVDMGAITDITGYQLYKTFCWNQGLTSVDLGNLVKIDSNGDSYTCAQAFCGDINLSTLDIGNLTYIWGDHACEEMFSACYLTSVNISKLTDIDGVSACERMFESMLQLSVLNISGLQSVNGDYACRGMFLGTGLINVTFDSLSSVTGNQAFGQCFDSCVALQSVSFPALTTSSFGTGYTNQFNQLVRNCSNVTIHFPSNLQSITALASENFSGTNTTVLFDLTATS